MEPLPHVFGDYLLVRPLGRGGMAEVFLALRRLSGGIEKRVCLKRILSSHAEDPEFRAMFLEEARIGASLRHENLVPVLDYGSVEGRPYLTSEVVEGCSLAEILRVHGSLPAEEVLHLAVQVATALAYLHGRTVQGELQAVVHRDVSPSNVLVSHGGAVKLTDFGIAKPLYGGRTRATLSETVKGKFSYLAPEMLSETKIGPKADLFALGVMLFECIAGIRPFDGPSHAATLHRIANGEPTQLSTCVPQVSPALDKVIHQLLERDPSDRPASADALLDLWSHEMVPVLAARNFGERAQAIRPKSRLTILPGQLTGSGVAAGVPLPAGLSTAPMASHQSSSPSKSTSQPKLPSPVNAEEETSALESSASVSKRAAQGSYPEDGPPISIERSSIEQPEIASVPTGPSPVGPSPTGPTPVGPSLTGPSPTGQGAPEDPSAETAVREPSIRSRSASGGLVAPAFVASAEPSADDPTTAVPRRSTPAPQYQPEPSSSLDLHQTIGDMRTIPASGRQEALASWPPGPPPPASGRDSGFARDSSPNRDSGFARDSRSAAQKRRLGISLAFLGLMAALGVVVVAVSPIGATWMEEGSAGLASPSSDVLVSRPQPEPLPIPAPAESGPAEVEPASAPRQPIRLHGQPDRLGDSAGPAQPTEAVQPVGAVRSAAPAESRSTPSSPKVDPASRVDSLAEARRAVAPSDASESETAEDPSAEGRANSERRAEAPGGAEPEAPARPKAVAYGLVEIAVVPWGKIWIDGRPAGSAPVRRRLPVGTYSVSAGQESPTRFRRIRVRPNRTTSYVIDVRSSEASNR
ncbi:MAG: protein kinase [Myxococcota bacterium]